METTTLGLSELSLNVAVAGRGSPKKQAGGAAGGVAPSPPGNGAATNPFVGGGTKQMEATDDKTKQKQKQKQKQRQKQRQRQARSTIDPGKQVNQFDNHHDSSGRQERAMKKNNNNLNHKQLDPRIANVADDPRDGMTIKRAAKGRNTESFDPESTLVRPSMRISVGAPTRVYSRPLKHDDVVIVPNIFCDESDLSMYYALIEEMRAMQAHGNRDAQWIPWHEATHLISKKPDGCPTYERVLQRCAEYFNLRATSTGTRFNWYRDSSDWKPFHHDSAAFNPQRARNQNITIGVSFGAERELSFLNVKTGERIYFPQPNGCLFAFGRDVNIAYKHGVNALPPEEHDGMGRVSIIVWGWAQDVIEEDGSPPMITNDSRNGYDNRRGGRGGGRGRGRGRGSGSRRGRGEGVGVSAASRSS